MPYLFYLLIGESLTKFQGRSADHNDTVPPANPATTSTVVPDPVKDLQRNYEVEICTLIGRHEDELDKLRTKNRESQAKIEELEEKIQVFETKMEKIREQADAVLLDDE